MNSLEAETTMFDKNRTLVDTLDGSDSINQMENFDSGEAMQVLCTKRMLSTEDPDYARPPNAKRMREMERKAQDELSGRVIKVVDKELSYSVNEKQNEIEEIDNRILRLQQCLHTLRYCVSLNYYAANKSAEVTSNQKNLEIHPAVRRHLGKAPRHSSSLSQVTNSGSPSDSISAGQSASRESSTHGNMEKNILDGVKESNTESKEAGLIQCQDISLKNIKQGVQDVLKSQEQRDGIASPKSEAVGSRPPSPKYLPPKPPDNPQTIAQGRHQRFQAKKRVVVGNTYQYLPPLTSGETGDALRYKWQVYIRTPTQDDDISSFISAVTFILDQSYAPHHVITVKHPPFVLSRRGWGEFKIQIVLKFADCRNKQVKLLHPLTLSRADDPLALTGLWRLGQENWYDIWVYEQDKSLHAKIENMNSELQGSGEESCPANLEKELIMGVVSHKVEENTTVEHIVKNSSQCGNEETLQAVANKREELSEISEDSTKENAADASKPQISSTMKLPTKSEIKEQKDDVHTAKSSIANGAQGKVCKIHVRQPDGSLVPYFIPAHMYSLALKIAQTGNKTQGKGENCADEKQVSPTENSGQLQIPKTSQQLSSPKQNCEDMASLKQETKETLNPQEKTVKVELKSENGQETSKGSGIPVKIFNISPNKGTIKASQVLMNQLPSSSGSQSVPKLTLTTQGKQTVARVSAGSLSQSALQQLLVKAGLKDKKPALVKKLLNKSSEVNGETVQSLQLQEGQVLSAQSPLGKKSNIQFLPVKILQDKQSGGSSATRIVKKPISAANIRFVTNNGQLISAGQLAKGITIPVASKPNASSELSGNKCILASSSASTTASGTTASVVMMPGGRILTGSGGLQLVTSQGKNTVIQQPSLTVYSSAQNEKTTQPPPLIVRNAGNNKTLCTLSNSSGLGSTVKNIAVTGVSLLRGNVITSVNPANVRTLLKPLCITTTAGVTATTPVFTNVSTKVTSAPTALKSSSMILSTNDSENISGAPVTSNKIVECMNEAQELNAVKKWESKVRQLKAICRSCRSLDACISIWVRALPLVSPPSGWPSKHILPFCAGSQEEFKLWPLGKQRAAEFQRAREVKRFLNECGIEGSDWWTTTRIVAWARCHAYTPVKTRPLLQTDKFCISLDQQVICTVTHLGNFEELEGESKQSLLDSSGHQEIDVVSFSQESKDTSSPLKYSASPRKEQSVFIPWEDQEVVEGCEWIGHLSSQLRINQSAEEVIPGYRADVARATMWKAMLNLMEDLLRSSHCEAWGEESGERSSNPPLVPPKEITSNHVVKALTTRRQEFQIFTNYGLGSMS